MVCMEQGLLNNKQTMWVIQKIYMSSIYKELIRIVLPYQILHTASIFLCKYNFVIDFPWCYITAYSLHSCAIKYVNLFA